MTTTVEFKGCLTTHGWIMPPGRAYILNLPIMLELPILRERVFFVHKSIPGAGTKWTVTDGKTGRQVASGRTRALAGEAAQTALRKAGPECLANAFRGATP